MSRPESVALTTSREDFPMRLSYGNNRIAGTAGSGFTGPAALQ
jgi:hypothetical protein